MKINSLLFKVCLATLLICISAYTLYGHFTNSEITKTINKLYSNQQRTISLGNYDKSIFTDRILKELNTQFLITQKDKQRINSSNSPTDKPYMFDGSVFTSLFDGYSTYTIEDISRNGNQAKIRVNLHYGVKDDLKNFVEWEDIVILEKKDVWKIDNIIFDTKFSDNKDLVQRLREFIKEAEK